MGTRGAFRVPQQNLVLSRSHQQCPTKSSGHGSVFTSLGLAEDWASVTSKLVTIEPSRLLVPSLLLTVLPQPPVSSTFTVHLLCLPLQTLARLSSRILTPSDATPLQGWQLSQLDLYVAQLSPQGSDPTRPVPGVQLTRASQHALTVSQANAVTPPHLLLLV